MWIEQRDLSLSLQCGVVTQSEAVSGGVETDGPAAALLGGQTHGTERTTGAEDAGERGQRTTACRQLRRGRPLCQLNGKAPLGAASQFAHSLLIKEYRDENLCVSNQSTLK